MKTKTITLFLSLTLSAGIAIALFGNVFPLPSANADLPLLAEAGQSVQQGGVMFVENMGQFDARARFQAQVGLGVLWLAEDALWLTVAESPPFKGPEGASVERDDRLPEAKAHQVVNLRLSFPNANPRPRLESFDRQETVAHYYRGSDPSKWQTNVPVWGGARYVDIYPNVDLEVSGVGGRWTWRLVCRADCQSALRQTRLRVEGSATVAAENGYLHLTTAVGDIALPLLTVAGSAPAGRPAASRIAGGAFEVAAPFAAVTPGGVASPQATYPEEAYFSTYLGGNGYDAVGDIAVGGQGDILNRDYEFASGESRSIWVTGWTASTNFPTEPGEISLSGDSDIFVTRLKRIASLVKPTYSAYIGGSTQEKGAGIVLDNNDNVYVTGWTTSSDFPTTPNALDQNYNSAADGFVMKMNSSGALLYSTYLGGSGDDNAEAIAVDAQGIVYVAGYTHSDNFPATPGAYDTVFSNIDIGLNDDTFIVKLDPTAGSAGLLYGTFIGGGTPSRGQDIAIDGSGNVYVTGYADGSWSGDNYFPTTPGAYSVGIERGSKSEVFILKLNPAGNGSADLLYSTFLGKETSIERGEGIALDAADNVYICGRTDSPDFPTTSGAYDTICGTGDNCNGGRYDFFVSKLRLSGSGSNDLLYSTFLGGNYFEGFAGVSDIALDANGDVYVAGDTGSDEGFPITSNAYDLTPDSNNIDAFVTRLRLQGNGADDLVYSTYVGNYSREGVAAIALDKDGRVYVAGDARPGYGNPPVDFPTTLRAFNKFFGGVQDAFVFRLLAPPTPDLSTSTKTVDPGEAAIGQVVTFTVQLANSGLFSATVTFTDTLPTALLLQGSPTASSGNAPGVQGQTITWSGTVTEDTSVAIRYTALLTSTNGTATFPVVNEALIDDGRGNMYTRRAFVNAYKVFLPVVFKQGQDVEKVGN